tara:strand:+ start:83 stop:589 length:507 start_codon:yes stop_codon:yes gene_type:complete
MAGFHTETFIEHDDYFTPKYAWENIIDYIPKDKVIWECFYGDGNSGKYLEELGLTVIHEEVDFFTNNFGSLLCSNPPYSLKKKIFTRLKELDKPFIMICPSSMINTQYIKQLFSNSENPLQIIIPRKRINFTKKINGKIPENWGNRCNFDCFYYCYKIDLEKDIIWLD